MDILVIRIIQLDTPRYHTVSYSILGLNRIVGTE